MAESNLDKFRRLLAELFMFDQADLDFGIYRIMNAKRDEITRFLDNDLLPQVRKTLASIEDSDRSAIEAELTKAIEAAKALGADPDTIPKVKELRQQLGTKADLDKLENEVFSNLFDFFRRYYHEGDFLSLRRYKPGVYAIPYEGEEVKLHWANADQYYIKTSEYFRDYTFKLADGRRVHFRIAAADTEKDNVKATADKDRRFLLVETDPVAEENGELVIRFEYHPDDQRRKQAAINEATAAKVLASTPQAWQGGLMTAAPTESNPKRTILDKHLTDYTARNTFDYFIHKDLGGFLRRELDFYIKNEVVHLDDIENETPPRAEQYLNKVKAIRSIAHKIIDFLAQLEDFQKKLWLKKKFIVETNYCISIDRIPEELYQLFAENNEQRDDWVRLFQIDQIRGDLGRPGYSTPLTVEFLRSNRNLPIDTRFYSPSDKDRIISSLSDVESSLEGTLVKSESFQALQLISHRHSNSVRCVYIDPPFNLGETPDYLYKVDYKDSTWLTLLQDRILVSKILMNSNASILVRCSHDGNMFLRLLLNSIFGFQNFRNEIIVRRAEESKGDLNKQFETMKSITVNYDNIYWYSQDPSARFDKIVKPTNSEQAKSHWHSFWKAEDRPNLRYEILGIDLRNHYGQWMWKSERAMQAVSNYELYSTTAAKTGESLDDYWLRTGSSKEFVRREGDGYSSIKYWIPPREYVMADNNWLDIKGYANNWGFKTENSELLLKRIIESLSSEGDLVLDYFLGSGTTSATAHKLGRKWLGVEMGDHFFSVVIPRMKNVLFGEQSGISKTVNWEGGGGFKYCVVEGFEDTLQNLVLHRSLQQQILLDESDDVREDYTIRYMIDSETAGSPGLLNVDSFEDPFNYKLRIATGSVGEAKEVNVDLVETFNYLIGLRTKHIDNIKGIKVVQGTNPAGEKVLIIWRNVKETPNEKLDEFFLKQKYNTRDMEFDLVYVNGDNNLENLKRPDDTWKVRLLEEEFLRLMFDVEDV